MSAHAVTRVGWNSMTIWPGPLVRLPYPFGALVAHAPATGGLGDAINLSRVGDECCGGVDPDIPLRGFLEINNQARSRSLHRALTLADAAPVSMRITPSLS